jgi:SAM-dependent methyltransferase
VFSSTDGGSIDGGAHDYRISTAWWLYRRAYGEMPFRYDADAHAFAPVNVLPRDASPDVLRRDAEYAVRIGSQYVRDLDALGVGPDGAAVLEIGPGHHLGTALVLAGAGYDVTIADPYPLQWDPGYHQPLYERVREIAATEIDGWRDEPVDRVLAAGDHDPVILTVPASAEDLGAVEDASFDGVVSTAVLEHVRDPRRAVRELARVTRPGGVGMHQVDHRDHRDFSRPLEYLHLPDDEFDGLFDGLFGECGNRIRPHELAALFREAGFEIEQQRVTQRAEAAYAARVARRLRDADGSRYRGAEASDIEELSCWFAVRRQSG